MSPLFTDKEYLLTLDGITENRMLFLKLDFLTDRFFAWDGGSDPMLQVAAHFLERKRDRRICESLRSFDSDVEELIHQHDVLLKESFGTVTKLMECCRVMANQSMHICAFKELSSKLKIVDDVSSNLSHYFFWSVLRLILVPDTMSASSLSGSVQPIIHTTSMLLTRKGAKPQAPHLDYSCAELQYGVGRNKEICFPWGMDFALARGGFRLNVWDGEVFDKSAFMPVNSCEGRPSLRPETNHAIILDIPQKTIFLMRGDVVHGGALDNSLGNGALRLHWYLSPGARTEREAIAHGKWGNSNVYRDAVVELGSDEKKRVDRKSLLCYLVDSEGNPWLQE